MYQLPLQEHDRFSHACRTVTNDDIHSVVTNLLIERSFPLEDKLDIEFLQDQHPKKKYKN